MKVTKEKAAENRTALVRAAGKLFRKHGIDGVGVAEISKEAGLTHGALYAQFPSKDALAAEALAEGLARSHTKMMACGKNARATIADYLDFLISKHHRDDMTHGCAMAASGSEIARQDKAVSRTFADGFELMVETIEAALGDSSLSATTRERALALAAGYIGAIVVARGVTKSRPRLSEEILAASRHVLGEVGGERKIKRIRHPRARSARKVVKTIYKRA